MCYCKKYFDNTISMQLIFFLSWVFYIKHWKTLFWEEVQRFLQLAPGSMARESEEPGASSLLCHQWDWRGSGGEGTQGQVAFPYLHSRYTCCCSRPVVWGSWPSLRLCVLVSKIAMTVVKTLLFLGGPTASARVKYWKWLLTFLSC